MQDFHSKTNAFLLKTKAFLLKTKAFLLKTKAFLLKTKAFLLKTKAFLLKTKPTHNFEIESQYRNLYLRWPSRPMKSCKDYKT